MEGDYHGQRSTTWSLCKEGVTPSDIHRRLSTVYGEKDSARSSSSFVQLGTELQCRRGNRTGVCPWVVPQHPKEWLREAIRKLPKEMATSYKLGEEYMNLLKTRR